MIKAGALLYTVLLSFIISLITGFFILASSFHNKYIDIAFQKDKVIDDVNSATNLILSDFSVLTEPEMILDLYDDGIDKVKIVQKPWGMYNIICASAGWKSFAHTKTMLVGDDVFNSEKVSLYLVDQNNYLSLCGKTVIRGLCYLPELGVRRAYIEGQSFSGSKLVEGEIRQSSKSLPAINKDLLERNIAFLNGKSFGEDSIRNYLEFEESDTIFNSFSNKTLILNVLPNTIIHNKLLKGNIIIISLSPLEIDKSSCFEDVLIYTPSVILRAEFKGNLQIIATDSIIIEEKCVLKYPSQLCLISEKESFISLGKESEVAGAVVLYKTVENQKTHSKIIFEENSEVYGQVYCNDMVQLQGIICGSLYCKTFILSTASSVYENHLLNAEIDFSKLDKSFAGINLLNDSKKKEIIKWLY